jgi:voltage-gated potassium channel
VGSLMYLIEGPARGFDSIPTSMYWAVVTLTTVGYGDIIPQTPLGRFLASGLMILGYGVIAVPTGIVTTEMARVGMRHDAAARQDARARTCHQCGLVGHDVEAAYCRRCGVVLASDDAP